MIRWFGFVLIVCGASTCGILFGYGVKKELSLCRSLLTALNRMKWDLQFRRTPLPELLRVAADGAQEPVSRLFLQQADRIACSPSASLPALEADTLPRPITGALRDLFHDLGGQDAASQTAALELAIRRIGQTEEELTRSVGERSRVYRTLGVCAGISLAVILI